MYHSMIPNFKHCGGQIAIHYAILLLRKHGVSAFLFSKNKHINNSKYNTPLIDHIEDNTIVVYPEIIWGNPLSAKRVCRWLLYDPMKRGGKALLNSWGVNDTIVSYGNYAPIKCHVELSVTDFNEHLFVCGNNITLRSKKYYFIHKARFYGWDKISINKEIIYLQSLGFQELKFSTNKELYTFLSLASIVISLDLNTFISNAAVLCGCLSIVHKAPLFPISYDSVFATRGVYGTIGIKPYSTALLDVPYNREKRLCESAEYRKYIQTANNIHDFILYFKLI